MILKQYYLDCLSQASYLIGDPDSGEAAVVDPRRDVDLYLEEAAKAGLEIRHVLLTHFHADFVAGHLELRERTGARLHLGAAATAEYDFQPMADGGTLDLGKVRLQFLATPGHTPESTCIAVYDRKGSRGEPLAVLTGDTLFIGDVGRPDLMASQGVTAEELAGKLYDSLHQKLLELPDSTLVYPGHGAGSACGKSLSSETVSTIGDQRRFNYALQPMSKGEFIRLVTAGQPTAPAYFAFDADLNRRERPTLSKSLQAAMQPLSLEELLQRHTQGAQVLDSRSPDAFAAGHLAGSLNIGLGGRYAEWAGQLLDRERPILLVADPGKEEEAALRLMRIGFDHVAGYLQGGPQTFAGRQDSIRSVPRLSATETSRAMQAADPPLVLDVRGPGERQLGHIEGSLPIPLPELRQRAGELPRGRRIVVQCAGGYRSMIGASILQELGFPEVADLAGGFSSWLRSVQVLS